MNKKTLLFLMLIISIFIQMGISQAVEIGVPKLKLCGTLLPERCDTMDIENIYVEHSAYYNIEGLIERGNRMECQYDESFRIFIDGIYYASSKDSPICEPQGDDIFVTERFPSRWISKGTHEIKVVHESVYDSSIKGAQSLSVVFTLTSQNIPPTLNPTGDKTVYEGQLLSFQISGSDPDGDSLTFIAGTLPQGASFNSNTRTFSWRPSYAQAGVYYVDFSVTDGKRAVDSDRVKITVFDVNRPPVLNNIGDKEAYTGQKLQFKVSGSDPDRDALAYSAMSLPNNATFNASTRTFTWIPKENQLGINQVTFIVADSKGLWDSEQISIEVFKGNQPPVIEPVGDKIINETYLLQFPINIYDPDGDELTLTYNFPVGASYNQATGMFAWTPREDQAGEYILTISANDGNGGSDTESFKVTVLDYDACIPNLVNSSWSAWSNVGTCNIDDNQLQTRTRTQYDSNNCQETEDIEYVEYKNATCDYCQPNWVADDWGDCVNNEQYRLYYDANQCYAMTGLESDLVGKPQDDVRSCNVCIPELVNETIHDWQNESGCVDGNQLQWSYIKQYDANSCGTLDDEYFDVYRDVSCEVCTPDMVNKSLLWFDVGECGINNKQLQKRYVIEYDKNNCGTFYPKDYYQTRYVNCDHCTPEWKSGSWSECVDGSQNRSYYDQNDCFAITGLLSDLEGMPSDDVRSCNVCIPELVNETLYSWKDEGDCVDGNQLQWNLIKQYDANSCGEVDNEYFDVYRNVSCEVCVPEIVNRTISDWSNRGECEGDNQTQKKVVLFYDANNCGTYETHETVQVRYVPCDSCVLNITSVIGECINGTKIETFVDQNSCYEQTGLEEDKVSEPEYHTCSMEPLAAEISASRTSGELPLDVDFEAVVSGGCAPYSYFWDFGDGYTDRGLTTSHIYRTKGDKNVILTVTDCSGDKAKDTLVIRSGEGGSHASTGRSQLYVSAVLEDEFVYSGSEAFLRLRLVNNAGKSLDNVRITVSAPDFGSMRTYSAGKMGVGDTFSDIFYLEVPEYMYPGEYVVKVSVDSDSGDVRRSKYLYIDVK